MRRLRNEQLIDEFNTYFGLWKDAKIGMDSEIESFVDKLKANPFIGSGATICYLIDYYNLSYLFIGENVAQFFGYPYEYIMREGPIAVLRMIHRDDIKIHLNFSLQRFKQYVKNIPDSELLNIKFSYNYRIRRGDGTYIHLLQQFVILKKDLNGNPLFNYGAANDISHIKKDNSIVFQVSRYVKGKGFISEIEERFPGRENLPLTNREVEIISLMNKGFTSKQIADKLFVSTNTILTHKNNMYAKTGKHGQMEIIDFARTNGLI